MRRIICINDITACTLEYQVTTIGKEIDERKANKEREIENYFISLLPRTAVSARTLWDVATLMTRDHDKELLRIEEMMKQGFGRTIDFEPIGI